jgi:hypothetical protein
MRATITCNSKGAVLRLGDVEFAVRDQATFSLDVAPKDLPSLVVLDDSALAILHLLQGGAGPGPRRRGRPPGRPAKTPAVGRSARRSGKRTGVSIWSGASSFNPRWSNLKPEEIKILGVNRLAPPLWVKVRDTIKGMPKDTWAELRSKWEPKLRQSAKRDDRTLAADWRAFVGEAQKTASS